MEMKRRNLLGALGATALSLGLLATPAMAAWPERPITMIVPWGAGGGTDAVARFVAAEVEKEIGQPINVVNRTGGSGVVGHQAMASAKPDGYTVGLVTVEITMMHHQGLTNLTYKELTPIALVNFDPNAVFVRADSPIKNVKDLLAEAKAHPGELKSSGTGQGGIWHLGLAGMLVEAGLPGNAITWV
ncbi:MAG: Bug family tripartite tricarboxylate transporter substrate binding protein, partial [Gammaproteobacteria bacterium]